MENSLESKSGSKFWQIFWSLFWILLIVLLVLKFFVFQQVTVVGQSMEPNYYTGELLLVNQIDKNFSRGQVVAVYEDKNIAKTADYWTRFQARFFLKRIIGLPEESVEMLGSKVIIYNDQYPNGWVLPEGYISQLVKDSEDRVSYYYPKTKVADKEYFVLGDNRTNSTDSRIKGAFPDYSIFGQESIRFWPFDRTGIFTVPNYTYQEPTTDLIEKLNTNRQKLQAVTIDNG